MSKENRLTEGRIATTLLTFAVPFMISSFLQALYGAIDLFVVGQYADSAAVSAVAIGSQVMQTITGIVLGISMGGTVLIGRCVGEKNDSDTAKSVGTLSVLFAVLALVLTPIMILFTNQAVAVMETPPEAVFDTQRYLLICSFGIPFIIGYNGVSGIFRGLGDSKTPVYFIALACVVNIVLDFAFVRFLHFGASGAALATIIAQAASFVASLLYIKKKGFTFKLSRSDFRLHKLFSLKILKVGFPLALQDALVNVSFLIITAIINTMGLIASASVGVVEKIIVFALLPPSAFASAVATMTAQNLGAGKLKRAKQSLWWGIGYSLFCGVLICGFAQFWPELVTALFSNDPAVIQASADYFRSFSLDCLFVSFVFCMNSYFNGCGQSLISFVHSMIATFLVRIPVTYLLSQKASGSLYFMGLAAPAASVVSMVICLFFLHWLNKKMAENFSGRGELG